MTILYPVSNNLYVNTTNRCPCNCTFCLRNHSDNAYGSDPLWLEREPTLEEIIAEFDKFDLDKFGEIVFCGFGEPTVRLDDIVAVAKFCKETLSKKTRLNTNGLSDKIHGKSTAKLLSSVFDTISISLNQADSEKYNAISKPLWNDSFEAIIDFAKDCKKYCENVVLTVVDVISVEDIEKCRKIAEEIGVTLKVRKFD